MDYEKKYNEAFEKARRLYEGRDKAPEEPILEYLFPELRESEDERIRKLAIDRVRNATIMTEGLRELLLTYLEKHKEQKPAEWSEEDEILRVRTINRLENLIFHGIPGKEICESIDWPKSLPMKCPKSSDI